MAKTLPPLDGPTLVIDLKKKFKVRTDKQLAEKLGNSHAGVQLIKKKPAVTSRQAVSLIRKASDRGSTSSVSNAISPVVEFYPITPRASMGGGNDVFNPDDTDGQPHDYKVGLKGELKKHKGIYVFFDSRGQAMYVGRTNKQTLWKELNLAFNRQRGDVQSIKRVNHPTRNQPYKTSGEKLRSIVDRPVPLADLAHYFSAYAVEPPLIKSLEAMLIRCFANNVLNIKMESFVDRAPPKAKKSTRKSPKKKKMT